MHYRVQKLSYYEHNSISAAFYKQYLKNDGKNDSLHTVLAQPYSNNSYFPIVKFLIL